MSTIPSEFLVGDLVSSARAKLLAAYTAEGVVGSVVGQDAVGDPYAAGWVFPGLTAEGRPLRAVEGTGKACTAIHDRTSWGSNQHNTARFPVLTVLTYADTSRNNEGQPVAWDAELRAKYLGKIVRDVFHDAANEDHLWPNDLFVVSSVEDGGWAIDDVPDGDGAVRLTQRFHVALIE